MIKLKGIVSEDLNGFMDEGTEFEGVLRFQNTFRIDGRVKGKIVSDNTLVVGETAKIDADIECGVVSIRGAVQGRVEARQRVELLAGCRVQGSLVSPRLVIEEGAFFQGDCDMSVATTGSVVALSAGRARATAGPSKE
jgi:cytoskeletal protein CcmA (bactofilin family)